ncbi:hypothetical protein [Streptomyces tailanensis]|uniref:hypothetical protein n=1 Tax=Streptomyces tailanensis TaxID=2569858 RepID=UPI00122E5F68|nr:hypothetical protein [Streptomyces tailanensis]
MSQTDSLDLFDQIRELRRRDERRSRAEYSDVLTLLLVAKLSEESNEAMELYRRSRGWGTDGVTNAEPTDVYDELCAAIMAGFVALDRICPDARVHWEHYLAYGYERAARENKDAAANS